MALEDYTTYTEVEPDDRIQKTANHIDAVLYDNEDAYLYKDKTASHFNGNFEHLLDISIAAMSANGAIGWVWALTNEVDDVYLLRTTYDVLGVRLDKIAAGNRIILYETVAGTGYGDTYTGLVTGTTYYLKIKRDEAVGTYGTEYCGIYSTAALRNAGDATDGDIDNLLLTLHEKEDFRYIYACSTSNIPLTPYATLDIDNLDLQEAPPAVLAMAGSISAITKVLGIISLTKPKFKSLFPKFIPRSVI